MATTTADIISIWYDTDSGNEPAWIVSRDKWDPDDGSQTTDTVESFETYQDAREEAIALAVKELKPVVLTHRDGTWETVWTPGDDWT